MDSPNTPKAERRLKRLMLTERDVFDLLLGLGLNLPEFVSVPVWDLPPGTALRAVYHEPLARCFWAVLSHPSWAEAPEGELPPEVDRRQVLVRVRKVAVDPKMTNGNPVG